MAKKILSSKSQNLHQGHQQPQQQPRPQHSSNQSGLRTIYGHGRIAPMASSRSEANLPTSVLRLPNGGHHPSLDHYGGAGITANRVTMLKTKVMYHSQRDFQEASV
jgi:hypothetical protein